MDYILLIVSVIFGVLIGAIFTILIVNKRKSKHVSCGTLVVDLSDPERDIFRIVLDEDLESLAKQTQVSLKVEVLTDSQQ